MSKSLAGFRIKWGIASVLTLSTVSVIALLMTTTTLLDIRRTRAIFLEELEQRGLIMSRTLNDALFNSLYFSDIESLNVIAGVVAGLPDVLYVRVFRTDGRLLTDTGQQGLYTGGPVGNESGLVAVRGRRTQVQLKGDALEVSSRIEIGGEAIGGLQFGLSVSSVEAEIRAITAQRVRQSLALIGVGLVMSLLMTQYFVRPIKRLVGAAWKVAEGEFEFSVQTKRGDEIGELTLVFAEMTGSLRSSRNSLERRASELRRTNEQLTLALSERQRTETALQESEERFRTVFESAPIGMVIVKSVGRLDRSNLALQQMLGYTGDELRDMAVRDVTHPDYIEENVALFSELVGEKRDHYRYEKPNLRKDGQLVWVQVTVYRLPHTMNEFEGFAMLQDITERKRAEEALQRAHDDLEVRVRERTAEVSKTNQILKEEIVERTRAEERMRASLKEKEVLLKEINHRVKNNLQLISSLLSLQSGSLGDEQARHSLKECQNRIRSMALIHQNLYQSEDLARIDFDEYIRNVMVNLFHAYGINPNAVTPTINVDDISLGLDTAVPCGLIINELVSNSLKHAFPGGMRGQIHIELRSNDDGQVTLRVGDNGVGFPAALDFRKTESLGLELVNTLADQLEGTIELHGNSGTEFEIKFRE